MKPAQLAGQKRHIPTAAYRIAEEGDAYCECSTMVEFRALAVTRSAGVCEGDAAGGRWPGAADTGHSDTIVSPITCE